MKKCLNCSVCPFVSVGKTVRSTANNTKIDINTSVSCTTSNVVYLIGCKKCTQQYIGETERTVKERFLEHKGYVTTRTMSKATGRHFNLPCHQKSHMSITVLESINTDDQAYRKRRESEYIQQFNLKYKGMNRRR